MVPNHRIVSIIPVELLSVAVVIAPALSGNPGDSDAYNFKASPDGKLPATHYALDAPCEDTFVARAVYFSTHPVELHAALQGILTQVQCDDYCTRSNLFIDADLAETLTALGLKRIEDFQ